MSGITRQLSLKYALPPCFSHQITFLKSVKRNVMWGLQSRCHLFRTIKFLCLLSQQAVLIPLAFCLHTVAKKHVTSMNSIFKMYSFVTNYMTQFVMRFRVRFRGGVRGNFLYNFIYKTLYVFSSDHIVVVGGVFFLKLPYIHISN